MKSRPPLPPARIPAPGFLLYAPPKRLQPATIRTGGHNMTRQPVKTVFTRVKIRAALLCFLLLLPALALAASAMVNIDVPKGTFKSIRLQTLPKGTEVSVRIESTGSIFVAMVNTKGYVSSSRPLFVGQIDKTISFKVTIPKLDDYYLVIDNRKGEGDRRVSIAFQAIRPSGDDKRNKIENL